MSRVLRKNYIGAFMVMLFALLLSMSAFAAEYKADAEVKFSVTMQGEKASSEDVTVTITPVKGAPEFDENSVTVFAKKGETVEGSFKMTSSNPEPVYESAAYGETAGNTNGFIEPGDYEYEVRQTSGNTDAYVYDDTVYKVIVAVRSVDGYNLKSSVIAYKNTDEKVKSIEFVNKYEPCFSDPPVKKVVINDDGTAPDNAKFRFSMKADDPKYPMPEGSVDGVKTITTGVGEYEFGNMYYEKEGTYTYKVVEENDGLPHFTYDGTMYSVKVVVEKKDGKLVATRTITYGDLVADIATFTNHYDSGSSKNNSSSSSSSTSSDGVHRSDWNDSEEYNDPSGSVLGAVRDAIEDGPVGQVLGAARDLVEDSPVGQVLGAVRGATRTGDNSFMMVSGLCFLAAMAVLVGWITTFIKRSR